jgi:hypothetical protein
MSEGRVSPNDSTTILRTGSRTIAIEKTAVPSPTRINNQVFSHSSPNCLLLREESGGRLKLLAESIGMAIFITSCCAGMAPGKESPLWWWVIFSLLVLILIAIRVGTTISLFSMISRPPTRYLFDRNEGRMKFFHESRTLETRLLTDIMAVQIVLCDSGYDDMGQRYEDYQVNLVCDEPYEPRLNLINADELSFARQSGNKLADFLQVPLLDQTQADPPTADE